MIGNNLPFRLDHAHQDSLYTLEIYIIEPTSNTEWYGNEVTYKNTMQKIHLRNKLQGKFICLSQISENHN